MVSHAVRTGGQPVRLVPHLRAPRAFTLFQTTQTDDHLADAGPGML